MAAGHTPDPLAALREAITGKDVLLLDIPLYFNIGDYLIYQGTLAFIRSCQARLIGRMSVVDSRARLGRVRPAPEVVILLSGGGNLGDLYPRHQRLRQATLAAFPDNRIIILPQSIHFEDEQTAATDLQRLADHPHLLLCVRDQFSQECATRFLDRSRVLLAPDMALCLGDRFASTDTGRNGTLVFRRRDKEALQPEAGQFDWDDLVSRPLYNLYRLSKRLIRLQSRLRCPLGGYRLFDCYARLMVGKAVRHYARFSTIDADRLHGLILGQLLDKQLIIRDNSYGKLSRYFAAWPSPRSR